VDFAPKNKGIQSTSLITKNKTLAEMQLPDSPKWSTESNISLGKFAKQTNYALILTNISPCFTLIGTYPTSSMLLFCPFVSSICCVNT
jgi:hypothetical protein